MKVESYLCLRFIPHGVDNRLPFTFCLHLRTSVAAMSPFCSKRDASSGKLIRQLDHLKLKWISLIINAEYFDRRSLCRNFGCLFMAHFWVGSPALYWQPCLHPPRATRCEHRSRIVICRSGLKCPRRQRTRRRNCATN
jgi:hypothetical protein